MSKKGQKVIQPANEVIGLGMLIPKCSDSEKIWGQLLWVLHKEKRANGDIVCYGEIGFDKDEKEQLKRRCNIDLCYTRLRGIKLIDVVPNFEKKWAELNMDTSYGDDGWDVEYEREKQRRKRRGTDGYIANVFTLPANNTLRFLWN